MNWSNFLSSLIGTGIGGFITWLFAKIYYQKASEELRNEAGRLKKLIIQILEGMEIAGSVTLTRDNLGIPIGFALKIRAIENLTVSPTIPTIQLKTEKPG